MKKNRIIMKESDLRRVVENIVRTALMEQGKGNRKIVNESELSGFDDSDDNEYDTAVANDNAYNDEDKEFDSEEYDGSDIDMSKGQKYGKNEVIYRSPEVKKAEDFLIRMYDEDEDVREMIDEFNSQDVRLSGGLMSDLYSMYCNVKGQISKGKFNTALELASNYIDLIHH